MRKEIKADEPIPCILDTEHSATEISLAENAIRSDMHPADQYEAFVDEGLLIDSAGRPTTDPGVMYNAPYGAILPFGPHKGGGLAVICDLLAGALTGGRTHSPRTIKKDGTAIINNMLSIIIDPEAMGGTFEDEVEAFIGWVKSARPQAGVAEVLAPG